MSSQIRTLVDTKVAEAGGDTYLGYNEAARVIENLMVDGKVQPKNFSLRGLFENLVDGVSLGDDAKRVAEALNTSAFPVIASKIIHRDLIQEYELAMTGVDELVREIDSSGRTDKELFAGIEAGDYTPRLRPQGMAYEETQFGEKDWEGRMADFGRMISMTREMIYEDRTGSVLQNAREIGRAAGQHKAKMIIQTIEGTPRTAFNEAAFRGAIYKGTALAASDIYADTHVALDGQVNDTLAASNALVDYTDLDNVMQLFSQMTNEAGDRIDIVPDTILVPNALKVSAYNILNTTSYMYTGNTDRGPLATMNPIQAIGDFKVVSSIWLSNASSWYMGRFNRQLVWINVFPPATASQGANSELAFTNQIVARFRFNYHGGVAHTDWRYIVKSNA